MVRMISGASCVRVVGSKDSASISLSLVYYGLCSSHVVMATSNAQIDRLGDRLRLGSPSEADLRALDGYRRSFGEAYETVVKILREQLHLQPTGRPAKSTSSIVDKLQRESSRLILIQDIAGCRVVVTGISEQDRVVASLISEFPQASVVDRRTNPSYGYRAVHIIVQIQGRLVEIQVRTSLQHSWAELSEKCSDVFDPAIKYGGGDEEIRALFTDSSGTITRTEGLERQIVTLKEQMIESLSGIISRLR